MGAWTEIVDFTFTANETSRAFTGLNITKDDFIKVVTTIVANLTSNQDYGLLANNSTNTDYHTQQLQGAGTNISPSRENLNRTSRSGQGNTTSAVTYGKLSENDRFNLFSNYNFSQDSNVLLNFPYITSSGATFSTGITSLTLQSAVTDGIGTGSRIQIYRLDAEKVADITTTANATQVDISSLSIGKDSEYLLVSDVAFANNTHQLNVCVNDNTTLTNYYTQLIVGNGSTAAAVRNNSARIQEGGTNQNSIGYAYIKLSEIGAFTAQSYSMRDYGGSTSLEAQNWFVSSTAENITSITKLNLLSGAFANTIGSGSRFILYKLK
jgi:hypothetical protein